jgi:asparagine synthase (glutamine-hydrolysing)
LTRGWAARRDPSGGGRNADDRETRHYGPLDIALEAALAPWGSTRSPLALLFSGGVDSGLLAWELRRRSGLVLSTVGTSGSADLLRAGESATELGLPWLKSEVTGPEVRAAEDRLRRHLGDLPRTARSVLVAFALAVARAPADTILCGQGADELFLGYAHFRGLAGADADSRSDSDLHQLIERDWPRSQRIAAELGRTVIAPYLSPEFVEAARAVPIELRIDGATPKRFFREWAMHRGLPAGIALRPKRAMQYGSGIDRFISRGDLRGRASR